MTGGKYAFSVNGPDGFLSSFACTVMPASHNSGRYPSLPAAQGSTVEITLASNGQKESVYTVTKNDYEGRTRKVTVKAAPSPPARRPTRSATTTW